MNAIEHGLLSSMRSAGPRQDHYLMNSTSRVVKWTPYRDFIIFQKFVNVVLVNNYQSLTKVQCEEQHYQLWWCQAATGLTVYALNALNTHKTVAGAVGANLTLELNSSTSSKLKVRS